METDVSLRIVLATTKMVKKYGIRNVSMDDIAREVGISKRTLYQHFPDKAALLAAVIERHEKEEHKTIAQLMETSPDALTAFIKVMSFVSQMLKDVSPLLLFELRRYYPQIWQKMKAGQDEVQLPSIKKNLQRGIEEGIYRADIDVEVLARLRMGMMEVMLNEDLYPPEQFDFNKLQTQFSLFFLYGLLTEKGYELLKKLNVGNELS